MTDQLTSLNSHLCTCKRCKAYYICITEIILFHRIQEHKGESSNKTDSAIHQHQLSTTYNIDFENVRIIDRAKNDFKLQFKVILQIEKRKPSLLKQFDSNDSYRIKTIKHH